MQRRTFLQLGVGSAIVLAVVGGGVATLRPGLDPQGHLTDAGRTVFAAIARAVLDGALPTDAAAKQQALDVHLQRLDGTLAGFPALVQAELSQLLALLASPVGRMTLASVPSAWADASVDQIQSGLQSMRTASLSLRQQAYHALRDLTNAAYFADASAWSRLGYPGPRAVG